jgi:hypothetical protein
MLCANGILIKPSMPSPAWDLAFTVQLCSLGAEPLLWAAAKLILLYLVALLVLFRC